MRDLIEQFIISRRLSFCSEKTIRNYCDVLRLFEEFANERSLSLKLVNDWNISLQNRGLSRSTVRSYLIHVRAFVNWASSEELCDDFGSKIRLPKPKKKVVRLYTEEEFRMIMEACVAESEWLTRRNRAIILLMYDTGLRQSEPGSILRENLDLENGFVSVIGKGDKERYVHLGHNTCLAITAYLEECPYTGPQVFFNRNGEPLTGNAVKLFVQKMKKKLPFEFGCHRLRHNYATNFFVDSLKTDGKADIYALKSLMGHEAFSTTENYMQIAQSFVACSQQYSHVDTFSSSFGGVQNSEKKKTHRR